MEKSRLDIDKITAGMKLAEPVTNSAGVTLMPEGIRLTPMFINRLKKWNIESLVVYVDTAAREDMQQRRARTATRPILTVEQEEFAKNIAADVSRRFTNVKDDPLMIELRNVAIKRLIAHGKDGMINIMRMAAGQKGR